MGVPRCAHGDAQTVVLGGDGVANIHRSCFSFRRLNIDLVYNTFEVLTCCLRVGTYATIHFVFYRPGSAPPNAEFFTELSALLEVLATYKSDVILSGDFNIHFDDTHDQHGLHLIQLFSDCNLTQHVRGPTHVHDHTLGLIVTSTVSPMSVIVDPHVYSDHGLVSCLLPPTPITENVYN